MRLALSLALVSAATASLFACAFDPNAGFGDTGSGGRYVPPGMTGTGNTIVKDPGQCIKEPGSDVCMSVCNTETHVPAMLPPDLLIVLDKSQSMTQSTENADNCVAPDCINKWVQVTQAINNVVGKTENNVNFGLKYYSNSQSCGVNNNVAVPIAAKNAAAIASSIEMTRPSGNTPTRAAMTTAVTYMQTVKDQNPKYILLATDGQPNCAGSGGGSNTTPDDAAAIQAVASAFNAGFPTFIVGISLAGSTAEGTLNSMAMAGGVPNSGATPYYSVASTADLEKALLAITGQIATCNYPLAPASPTNDPNAITVHVGGKTIPRDGTNGWEYTTPAHTAIKFFGSSCDTIMKDKNAKVEIFYACMGQPPVP